MADSRCREPFSDPGGILYGVAEDVESLYEAVALSPSPITEFTIAVHGELLMPNILGEVLAFCHNA
jgi:hypothetical protein